MSENRNEVLASESSLNQTARRLVECLGRQQIKMVLAESCTCGRAVAALGTVSGVSQFLCGGLVVYRPESKSQWLGLDPAWLAEVSTESLTCSEALAVAALRHTPEAQFSLAITGDLDPSAAPTKQGRVFLAAARRQSEEGEGKLFGGREVRLQSAERLSRQIEAAQNLLQFGIDLWDG
ncbi:MAG: CinA family protein [Planctomycetaceae bacterium]|nr:CinA family protein [Planctomycetaceae bacterium]